MSKNSVEVYRDKAGKWRWRTVASNHEIVATSGEGYVNQADAADMAYKVNGVDEILIIDDFI